MNKLYSICSCGFDLDGGYIFSILREQDHFKGLSDIKLHEYITDTYPPPYIWSKAIGIELGNDRTVFYICPNCKKRL